MYFIKIEKFDYKSINLQIQCDSDYARDKIARRSISGVIIWLNDNVVYFKANHIKGTCLSVTEAEYRAAGDGLMALLSLMNLFTDLAPLTIKKPAEMQLDNSGAIFISKNSVNSNLTKHIEIRHHFIRDHIDNGTLRISHIDTADNISDFLTKPEVDALFIKNRDLLMQSYDESQYITHDVTYIKNKT